MNLIFEITLIELHREAAVDNNDGVLFFSVTSNLVLMKMLLVSGNFIQGENNIKLSVPWMILRAIFHFSAQLRNMQRICYALKWVR